MSATPRDTAITLMKVGKYQAALHTFQALIAEHPKDTDLLYMAGQCARFSNDVRSAIAYLSRAAELDNSEPQVFLALGIAHQLHGELDKSENALRKALELNSDMDCAYNSLAITQKKMGKFDFALHNQEAGLKALSRSIARTMKNIEEKKIFPHPDVRGMRWGQYAMNAAMYLVAIEPDIRALAWPTGDQVIAETQSQAHRGLYWQDTLDAEGVKTRLFLPNFFNTFFSILRREKTYPIMLGNLGSLLEVQGNHEEAKLCFDEANEFLVP